MFHVVFCIAYFVVSYLNVSFIRIITSVGERRAVLFCYRILVTLLLLHRNSTVARRVTKVTSEHYGDP